MKKNINKNSDRGFTIIETLVAITILMVSIAGPLTIAQKGLTASIYARDQVTASFLAQDLIEEIKNDLKTSWSVSPGKCTSASLLYISNTTYIYSTNPSGGTASRFTRGCNVDFVNTNTNNEIKITVNVTWSNGTVSNQVSLSSLIYNISL